MTREDSILHKMWEYAAAWLQIIDDEFTRRCS